MPARVRHMKPFQRCFFFTLFAVMTLVVALTGVSAKAQADDLIAMDRSEWGGHPVKTRGVAANQYKPSGTIKYISLHYTQSRASHPRHNEKTLLRFVQEGHRDRHNFGDIAYHYLIGISGTVYKGRDDRIAPATHTHYYGERDLRAAKYDREGRLLSRSVPKRPKPGRTEGHLTVTFILGYGEPDLFPPEAMAKAARLVAQLLVKYDLTPDAVRAHREIAITACPGDALYHWLRGPEKRRDSDGVGMKMIRAEYKALTE